MPRTKRRLITRYLITVEGGVEPQLHGPYKTEARRDQRAREINALQDRETDSLFRLMIVDGEPVIGSFTNAFFEGG